MINDIAVTSAAVFVTDSFRPVLYRLPLSGDDVGEPEEWLRLDDGPVRYGDGFNLNGVVTTDDERWLVVVKYNTGELFRIEIATGEVTAFDLGGETVENGDGMLLEGSTLYVARAAPEREILEIALDVEAATRGASMIASATMRSTIRRRSPPTTTGSSSSTRSSTWPATARGRPCRSPSPASIVPTEPTDRQGGDRIVEQPVA